MKHFTGPKKKPCEPCQGRDSLVDETRVDVARLASANVGRLVVRYGVISTFGAGDPNSPMRAPPGRGARTDPVAYLGAFSKS